VGAIVAVAIVLAPGFVFHNPGAILFAMLFGIPIALIAAAYQALTRPYEVRIGAGSELTFISVLDRADIHVNDVTQIVQAKNRSNGGLRSITVEYTNRYGYQYGSITLDGNEEVLARLTELCPAAKMQTHEYDDTD
jgi:hypothetical protein